MMITLKQNQQRWIKRALSGEYNPEAAEKYVKFIYGLAGYPEPEIVHCDSPRMVKEMKSKFRKEKKKVGSRISYELRCRVFLPLIEIADGLYNGELGMSRIVPANISRNVRGLKGGEPPDYDSGFDVYGWLAKMEIAISKKFENAHKWISLSYQSNLFETYSHSNICFVVKPPTQVFKNENGLMHNPNGPAIKFRDGFAVYCINGRRLPNWIWEKKDTITKNKFLKEKNAEIRGGMYAVLGQKKVFDLIGAEEISRKFANDETYILYRTLKPIGEKHWQWVGVTCPSTQTKYLLGVPDTVTCPLEGVAGTWGLSAKDYIINQHT